jgi:hypothetical protein
MKRLFVFGLAAMLFASAGCSAIVAGGPPCPLDRDNDGVICNLDFMDMTPQELAELQTDYETNPDKYSTCGLMLLSSIASGLGVGIPDFLL